MSDQTLWVQRTSPSTIVVRRGFRIVLSVVGDAEAARIGRELLEIASPPPRASEGDR